MGPALAMEADRAATRRLQEEVLRSEEEKFGVGRSLFCRIGRRRRRPASATASAA